MVDAEGPWPLDGVAGVLIDRRMLSDRDY